MTLGALTRISEAAQSPAPAPNRGALASRSIAEPATMSVSPHHEDEESRRDSVSSPAEMMQREERCCGDEGNSVDSP